MIKKSGKVYLDLTKAFDTVDHDTLLSKLVDIGIKIIAFKLIKSYLSLCFQYVKLNNTLTPNYILFSLIFKEII